MTTVAEQCFAAAREMGIADTRLERALDDLIGGDGAAWDDYTYDLSDASLEVYSVRQGTVAVAAVEALGFELVWLHPLGHGQCGAGLCRCAPLRFPSR